MQSRIARRRVHRTSSNVQATPGSQHRRRRPPPPLPPALCITDRAHPAKIRSRRPPLQRQAAQVASPPLQTAISGNRSQISPTFQCVRRPAKLFFVCLFTALPRLEESLRVLQGQTLPTKRQNGRLSSPIVRPDETNDAPRSSLAPVPPPRTSRSPATHIPFRQPPPPPPSTQHKSDCTTNGAHHHHTHKKRVSRAAQARTKRPKICTYQSALDLPIVSDEHARTLSGTSRRTTLHTPISSPELSSWPSTTSTYVEPLQNPKYEFRSICLIAQENTCSYKRQSGHMAAASANIVNSSVDGRATPPPVNRAPPPPPLSARTPTSGAQPPPLVPKHLPLNPQQLQRVSPRVTLN